MHGCIEVLLLLSVLHIAALAGLSCWSCLAQLSLTFVCADWMQTQLTGRHMAALQAPEAGDDGHRRGDPPDQDCAAADAP